MAHRGIEERRSALASEVVQLERQLRLLIEGASAFLSAAATAVECPNLYATIRQSLEDRIETAQGYLA